MLDPMQLERLASIVNSSRREQFLSARALAQQLLRAEQVDAVLSQHENGRPFAPAWPHAEGLSWSHGAKWCAAALGRGRVGIDVETMRQRKQLGSIAEQYFDPREHAWLVAQPESVQLLAFYTLWVAKEALLKALGTGLVGGLARFVLLQDESGWRCEHPDLAPWSVQVWQPQADVLLALASDTPQTWRSLVDTQNWQNILQIV